jgi:hypothetical protein
MAPPYTLSSVPTTIVEIVIAAGDGSAKESNNWDHLSVYTVALGDRGGRRTLPKPVEDHGIINDSHELDEHHSNW